MRQSVETVKSIHLGKDSWGGGNCSPLNHFTRSHSYNHNNQVIIVNSLKSSLHSNNIVNSNNHEYNKSQFSKSQMNEGYLDNKSSSLFGLKVVKENSKAQQLKEMLRECKGQPGVKGLLHNHLEVVLNDGQLHEQKLEGLLQKVTRLHQLVNHYKTSLLYHQLNISNTHAYQQLQ